MLSRSVSRQLLRPAHRPATAGVAVAAATSTAPFSSATRAAAPRRTQAAVVGSSTTRPLLSSLRPSAFASPFTPASRRCISDHTREAIDRAVSSAPVVLFMKGTPELPQCGFSRASIQILGLQGVDPDKFAAFNVLEDPELRAGIKEYSDWPTIPQLYVDKEFVGGCDILIAMHQSGELAKLFEEKKVLIAPESESSAESAETPAEKKE